MCGVIPTLTTPTSTTITHHHHHQHTTHRRALDLKAGCQFNIHTAHHRRGLSRWAERGRPTSGQSTPTVSWRVLVDSVLSLSGCRGPIVLPQGWWRGVVVSPLCFCLGTEIRPYRHSHGSEGKEYSKHAYVLV